MTIPVNHILVVIVLFSMAQIKSNGRLEGSRNHPWGFGEIDSHILSGMLPGKQTFAHDDDVSLYNIMGE